MLNNEAREIGIEAEPEIRVMHIVGMLALAGMEYGVIKLVNKLDRSRFIPSIAVLDRSIGTAKSQVAVDVEIFELNKREGFTSKIILQLSELFRQQRIDIIHSHNWTTFLYAILAGRLARVPVILHGEHGRDSEQYMHDWKKKWIRKWLASMCDQLTTVSSDIKQILQNVWGVSGSKISYISNGVMLEKFKPVNDKSKAKNALNIPANKPTIGTIMSHFRPIKDLPTLFSAFKRVRVQIPEVQLLIVGYGPGRQQVEEYTKQLAISESVHFLGERSDIPPVMSALDVYVNSSLYEGMSNTILEAMACGVPVVATSVGGTPAIIRQESTGLLVPPKDSAQMSEAICRLLADDKKRKAIARAGRLYMERNHCFEETVRRYERLYLHWAYEKLRTTCRTRKPKQPMKAV